MRTLKIMPEFKDPYKLTMVFSSMFADASDDVERRFLIERVNGIFERATKRKWEVNASGSVARKTCFDRNQTARDNLRDYILSVEETIDKRRVILFPRPKT